MSLDTFLKKYLPGALTESVPVNPHSCLSHKLWKASLTTYDHGNLISVNLSKIVTMKKSWKNPMEYYMYFWNHSLKIATKYGSLYSESNNIFAFSYIIIKRRWKTSTVSEKSPRFCSLGFQYYKYFYYCPNEMKGSDRYFLESSCDQNIRSWSDWRAGRHHFQLHNLPVMFSRKYWRANEDWQT